MHAWLVPPAALPPPVELSGQDALALLATRHDQLRTELQRLDPALPVALPLHAELVEVCLALKIHGMLESELVYPVARQTLAHDTLIDCTEADHEEAQQLIEMLLALDVADPLVHERLHALHRTVERQFDEAEVALFSRLTVSELDLDDLGERLKARRREILDELGMSTSEV